MKRQSAFCIQRIICGYASSHLSESTQIETDTLQVAQTYGSGYFVTRLDYEDKASSLRVSVPINNTSLESCNSYYGFNGS